MAQIIDTTKGIGNSLGIVSEIPKPSQQVLSRTCKRVKIPQGVDINSPMYKNLKRKLLREGYVMENNFSFKKIGKKLKGAAKKVGRAVKKVGGAVKKVGGVGIGAIKAVGQGSKGDLKGAVSSVKSSVKGVKSTKKKPKSKKVVPIVAGDAILAPLIPMKGTMVKGLQAKGVKTNKMSMTDIVEQFHNKFVSKEVNPTSSYEPLPSGYLENHSLFNTPLDNYDFQDSVDSAQIGSIVTGVIEYFKKVKNKKKKGDKITETEKVIADSTEKVEERLIEKANGEVPVQKSEMNKYIKYGALALAVIIVIIVIIKSSK